MINLILFLYTLFLFTLFFYAIHSFILIYYYFRLNKNTRKSKRKELKDFPYVTIQLPIYNEKFVIHRLLKCVTSMDYPKDRLEIQVLDDSTDETVEIAADLISEYRKKGHNILHVRRGTRANFKAGALQYGLERARGEFIAIFDADFVPPPDFLKELLPEFFDQYVGGVQARWGHLNYGQSVLTRSQAIGLDNHFIMEQGLRSRLGCFINFNGTCGLWRKRAIIDAGGWHGDTLAEDLDLSYRVQLRGWRIKYRGDFVVAGELPHTAYGYRVQQNRWAKGTIQVARKLLSKIFRSRLRPLAKYEAFVHLTCHINFLAMLGLALFSLPVVYFKVEGIVSNTYYVVISLFTVAAFGYPFLYYLSQREIYKKGHRRRIPFILGVIAYSMGLSISNTKAIIEGWFYKEHVFTRTPKSGGARVIHYPEIKSLMPYLEILLGVYMLVGVIYVIANLQLVLVPFLVLYCYGFLSMGLSSIKDQFLSIKPREVLCSRENS
ncbi:MAG: glycosyl transferase family 2 [Candidatus Thorarchaeota archaeon]|nr:MAG: glycosyl transferase family 2 [Candidatus Thorarchaeota archaeon]